MCTMAFVGGQGRRYGGVSNAEKRALELDGREMTAGYKSSGKVNWKSTVSFHLKSQTERHYRSPLRFSSDRVTDMYLICPRGHYLLISG